MSYTTSKEDSEAWAFAPPEETKRRYIEKWNLSKKPYSILTLNPIEIGEEVTIQEAKDSKIE